MIRVLTLGLALLAAPVFVKPALAEPHRLGAAWEAAISEEDITLAPAARARLNAVAYSAAVAKLCEGFPVDAGKIAEASNSVLIEALAGLEGEALAHRHADFLIDIGTAHGLFLAEGSLQPERFCADAAAARDDAAFEDLWQ